MSHNRDPSIFLCFPMTDECCCCGGSATLGGTQEAVPGSVPSLRYCSIECHDEWEDFLAEQREKSALNWCSDCGYDCGEAATGSTDESAFLSAR